MRPVLAIHAILLLLASTDFTVVTAIFGDHAWKWCYFRYASQSGFGYVYHSEYTLWAIWAYLLAFVAGTVGFSVALQHGRRVVGTLGVVLSVLGLVSFAIEGSHWIFEHNNSWLAFSPAAMFVLVLLAVLPRRPAVVAESHSKTA